ncbi:phage tail tape measure protein [Paenirhodobacter sp.]|uniref:phage tail tape measure protein n=1 Tax=Paenirhodobacter sp. TaxID=1965326 RepID=UPI003B3EF387
MSDSDKLDDLSQRTADLERSLDAAVSVTGTFNDELLQLREGMLYTTREVGVLANSIGRNLGNAFQAVVFNGESLSHALTKLAENISMTAYNIATKPVEQAVGSTVANGLNSLLSGVLPFANGGAFSQGRVMPFAKGGVVSSPVSFPMRGATGLMGEAGAEAIMPLTRGADGRLGVQSSGGGRAVNVTMNVTAQDATSFMRSQSQIAAQINRALSRGQRNA